MRVVVKATNPDATIVEASQPTTLVQDAGPLNQSAPVISGTVQRGLTLTATAGSWSGLGNTYAFQWQISADNGTTWTNVSGATTSSYLLAVGDVGSQAAREDHREQRRRQPERDVRARRSRSRRRRRWPPCARRSPASRSAATR